MNYYSYGMRSQEFNEVNLKNDRKSTIDPSAFDNVLLKDPDQYLSEIQNLKSLSMQRSLKSLKNMDQWQRGKEQSYDSNFILKIKLTKKTYNLEKKCVE
jgi:hypothetical protein